MPLAVEVDVGELAATRFAFSPLAETIAGLLLLGGGLPAAPHERWLSWARPRARGLRLSATWPLLVSDAPAWPEFLLPAPAGPATGIDDDLAALRETGPEQVRVRLARVFGPAPPAAARRLAGDPARGLKEIAGELRAAYVQLIEPHWPRIRAVLEADVAYRAARLTAAGVAGVLASLHPDLRWRDGRLVQHPRRGDRVIRPAPGGLVLTPSALGLPAWIRASTSTRITVRYPARGLGALWTAGTRAPGPAVTRLLGRARAELLEALRTPASGADLARALNVTPSAVSQHLRVLREAALITGDRSGRRVLYRTTDLGLALLGPETGRPTAGSAR